MAETQIASVLDRIGAVKDTLTVSRAFGEAYQVDGVSVIPVASVRGAGGGGGGEGNAPSQNGSGSGAGIGFGVMVRPMGVYAVKDGEVEWRPAIDVMRIVFGGQVVAVVAILAIRSLLRGR